MRGIVIYKSKSGFSKRYAEMIAEELSYDLKNGKGFSRKDLINYDTIIYGGGLYIKGINGVRMITRNMNLLSKKKIIVFACGATPSREKDIKNIIDANFNETDMKSIRFFYLRGGFDYNKLNFLDKILMSLLKFKLKHKKNIQGDELGMLNAYKNPMDFVNRKNILTLVEYAKGDIR